MALETKERQTTSPFLDSLRKRSRIYEPVVKRAKLSSSLSPSQVTPAQSSQQNDFTVDDLQRCLFNTTNVKPINTQELINKRQGIACFWCDASSAIPNFQCPRHKHGLTASRQNSQLPLALKSLPPEVELCASSIPGAGVGICAKRMIPVGAWIGPFEGNFVKLEDLSPSTDTSYMWEIFKDGRLAGFVDGSDEKISSWMRFIRCARHRNEQNLFAFQYLGKVYYRSFKFILPGEEMLVWYDEKYPQYLGIPSVIFDMGAIAAKGVRLQPEKSGSVLPEEKDSSSVEDMFASSQFPPTPPSSVPSPSRPPSPNSQKNSPAKAVSGEPLSGLQSEVTSVFDFSAATVNCERPPFSQSPPISSPESIRSDTDSPNCSEDGNKSPTTAKQPVFTNITEMSLWKCGQCKKSFPQRTMLQVHICNEAPHKPYQCGHCAQSFSHPAQLRAHAVSHTSKKPFKCGYCSRAFAGATTLNNHIRTHTGEKPFVCDKCGKNFTQGSQLSRHQRIPGDCVARE